MSRSTGDDVQPSRSAAWATPRVLAIVGCAATLALWTAWVVFLAIKLAPLDVRDPTVWLLGVAAVALVGWPPLYAAALAKRLVRSGDMSHVGTFGAFLVLFGVPATLIACPLALPGVALVAASIWHRLGLRRSDESPVSQPS